MRGNCLCGDVAFRLEDPPRGLYQCHCSLCRKQGGSASNAAMIVEAAKFHWLTGQGRISSYVRPTGFRSDFCARCGSPVPNPLRNTSYYWVPVGLLDDAVDRTVIAHLFVGSKACWEEIGPVGTRYETMPNLPELVTLLRCEPPCGA